MSTPEDRLAKKAARVKGKMKCDKPGCDYVPENFVDFVDHLKSVHPEGGSTKSG